MKLSYDFEKLESIFANIQKNNFLINTILEVNQDFNIIFIQEPSWTTLRTIPSSTNSEGALLLGVPNHPQLAYIR